MRNTSFGEGVYSEEKVDAECTPVRAPVCGFTIWRVHLMNGKTKNAGKWLQLLFTLAAKT